MLVWCQFENCGFRLRKGQVTPAVINGLLLFVQIVLFTVGISMTSASHATVLINTFVLWVAGIDHFVTKVSRLTAVKIAGLLFAAAAGFIIFVVSDSSPSDSAQQDMPSLWGDLCLAASAFVLGIKIIYTKHAMRKVEAGKLIFWHDAIGVIFFAIAAILFESPNLWPFCSSAIVNQQEVGEAMLGLLYQGLVVAGFCFATQAVLLKRHSASQLSVFSFATPLFGITFAVLFRGEQLSEWLAVSGVCVAAGILLVNAPAKKT